MLLDADLQKLDEHFAARLGMGYDRGRFIAVVRERARRGIRAGLLFDCGKGLPKDFCELVAQEAKRAPVTETKPEPSIEQRIATVKGLLDISETHPQNAEWREELHDLQQRQAVSSGQSMSAKAGAP